MALIVKNNIKETMNQKKERKLRRKVVLIPASSLLLPLFFIFLGEFMFNPETRLILIYSSFILTSLIFLIVTLYFKKSFFGRYQELRMRFLGGILEGTPAIFQGIGFAMIFLAIGLPDLLRIFNLISKTVSNYLIAIFMGMALILWILAIITIIIKSRNK